jgi:hypothetical protein
MLNNHSPIDPKKKLPQVDMKVKELCTGKKAIITGVYEKDNEVWMVSGNSIGVFTISDFWEFFVEV